MSRILFSDEERRRFHQEIYSDLCLLASECRNMGSPSALAMLSLTTACIEYIERLYDGAPDEGVSLMGITATEVRQ